MTLCIISKHIHTQTNLKTKQIFTSIQVRVTEAKFTPLPETTAKKMGKYMKQHFQNPECQSLRDSYPRELGNN